MNFLVYKKFLFFLFEISKRSFENLNKLNNELIKNFIENKEKINDSTTNEIIKHYYSISSNVFNFLTEKIKEFAFCRENDNIVEEFIQIDKFLEKIHNFGEKLAFKNQIYYLEKNLKNTEDPFLNKILQLTENISLNSFIIMRESRRKSFLLYLNKVKI